MPEDLRNDRAHEALEASTRRWMVAGAILMGLFFLAFPVFRLYEPAQRADAREAQTAFLAAEGGELFGGNCAECHGVEGSGAIAPALGSEEFLASVDDTQIAQLTALGVPGTEMVAYSNDFGGPLTSAEITAVVTYLRSLEEDAPSIPNWRSPLDDENLTGGELFALACSRCHGVDREGIEGDAPDISADSPTMQESDAFLIGRITDGYKEMPRFGRILSQAQIESLVAFLRGGVVPPADTDTTTTTAPTTDTTQAMTTTTAAVERTPENDPVLALGELVFQERAGGYGCQECHGPDARGTPNGPSILGASRSTLLGALGGGIPDMDFAQPLTNEEVDAVFQYLLYITGGSE